MITAPPKDPQADLDYVLDWSPWLGNDTIIASTWTPTLASGITAHSDDIVDGKKTVVWLRGGNIGEGHTVTNHITTLAGRQDDRSLSIAIRER